MGTRPFKWLIGDAPCKECKRCNDLSPEVDLKRSILLYGRSISGYCGFCINQIASAFCYSKEALDIWITRGEIAI